MKRFVLKLCAGALALLALIALFNALYTHTDYYHDLNDTAKFRELPETLRAANLGNSHAHIAFDWSGYPALSGVNMALDSQTHCFDHAILCQYIDRFSDDAVLFVNVSCFSLYVDYLTEEAIPSMESRYYSFLKPRYIPHLRPGFVPRYGWFPVLGAQPKQLLSAFVTYERKEEPDENLAERPPADGESGMIAGGLRRVEYLTSYCLPPEARAQYPYVENILRLCREKGLRAVMTTTPTTPYYYEAFPEEYREAFKRDMAALLADYPEVVYLDYTGDPRFSDLSLYRDFDHLNKAGSALFMRALFDDLKTQGVDMG